MKNVLLALSLLFSVPSFAVLPVYPPEGKCINAATNNIPMNFDLNNTGSLILSLSNSGARRFGITHNTLGASTVFSVSTNPLQAVPGSTTANKNQIWLDSNLTPAFDEMLVNKAILVRSAGSSIVSGTLCVLVW